MDFEIFLNVTGTEKIQDFLDKNEKLNPHEFILRQKTVEGIPPEWLAWQLNGRQKARIKLPLFYASQGIVWPVPLSVEQCSSEITARYKAAIVQGRSLADLTGGFGVDSYFFSRKVESVVHVEPDEFLNRIAAHNFKMLSAENIDCVKNTAEDFLHSDPRYFDTIYLDPSRRNDLKNKTVSLKDHFPNVVQMAQDIFAHTGCFLLKASPLLDLKMAIRQLPHIKQVHIVSVKNECRELLFLMDKRQNEKTTFICVNLTSTEAKTATPFSFKWEEEEQAKSRYAAPLTYLYEPNASILKSGAFKLSGNRYGLAKLAPNTHFYTSDDLLNDFPGRCWKLEQPFHPGKKEKGSFFNLVFRNYPVNAPDFARKHRITEGGTGYLLGFRNLHGEPELWTAEKVGLKVKSG